MGFFQNLVTSPMKKKLRQYVEFLSVSRSEDIGMMLALGTVSRGIMIDNSESLKYLLDGNNSFNYDRGNKHISNAYGDLYAMASDLEREAKTNDFINVLMGGFAVWKMTIHCLIGKEGKQLDQEGYTIGRLIWKELDRGLPYVKEKLDELKENGIDVDDWHYENCQYAPEMFKV